MADPSRLGTSVLKSCISIALIFHEIIFIFSLTGFLNNRSKEKEWSDSNMSTTVRSSTTVAPFVISQSKVWPRRWKGTLTNGCKLRLSSTTLRAEVLGSEGLSKWTLRSPTTKSLSQETYYNGRYAMHPPPPQKKEEG